MGKIILFSLSVCYLFAEYIFNVNLVSMMGHDTIQNYKNVDVYGRSISSIGAVLIFLRIIYLLKIEHKTKMLTFVFLSPIIFFGVYTAQEKIVDVLTDNTPQDIKLTQSYTNVFKKGIVNSSLTFKDIPRKSKEKSAEDFVFS